MKLEDQVCSLDLAKRLKELGVKQESAFAWRVAKGTFEDGEIRLWGTGTSIEEWQGDFRVAAFTVAELGEMLPQTIEEENRKPYELCINHYRKRWQVGYEINGTYAWHIGNGTSLFETEKTEADARAKMLIYLIENKLITP